MNLNEMKEAKKLQNNKCDENRAETCLLTCLFTFTAEQHASLEILFSVNMEINIKGDINNKVRMAN